MPLMDVIGVRVELPTEQPVVLLRERGTRRALPIWIGPAEATAIATVQHGVTPSRPQTHDLLLNVLHATQHALLEVEISRLEDRIFHATLVLVDGAGNPHVRVDSRASDAIALAMREGADIIAAEEVLDEAGVVLPAEENDDEVERFKEFLDQVSPDDFDVDPP